MQYIHSVLNRKNTYGWATIARHLPVTYLSPTIMASLLDVKIQATRQELDMQKARSQHDQLAHDVDTFRMKLKMCELREKTKTREGRLHEYSSALVKLQAPSPPLSDVLQKQALLCRAVHRVDLQARQVEMVKSQCTELIRWIRENMDDLEDEGVTMEAALLKKVALFHEECFRCKAVKEDILRSQVAELRNLRNSFNPSEEEQDHTGPDQETLHNQELNEELVNAETDFNDTVSRSLIQISNFFSPRTKDEAVAYLVDSFVSNLEIERSPPPKKRNDETIAHVFDAFYA